MAFNNYDHIFTTSTLCIIVIFLYLMSCCHSCDSGTCLEKSHSMVCTTGNEECSTPFVCRSDKNNINRCLCAVNNYYTSSTTSCTSVTQLQVQSPSVQSRTTSSIYITWTVNSQNPANVNYKIQAGSSSPVTAGSNGGNATGLSPGQQYNLLIISTLPADMYYPDLTTNVSVTFLTSKLHGQDCSADFDCDNQFSCVDYKSGGKKCLCKDGFYYYTGTSKCTSITQLQVQSPSVQSRTTSSIYITWTVNSQNPANVNYKIQAGSSSPVTAGSNGGNATGLSPGQQYNLLIISTLPADMYYPDLTTNVSVTFLTSKLHGQDCSADFDCDNQFSCVDYKSSGKNCLCKDGFYYHTGTSKCTSITQLQVQTPSVQSRTTSSIYLTWSVDSGIPTNVNYKIQAGSLTSLAASSTRGNATGLSPGQEYNLRIISTLPADSYYPDLSTSVSVTYWTSNTYAGHCSDSTSDCDVGTKCITPFTTANTLCFCDIYQNYATDNFRCLSLSSLQVKNVQWTVGTHSINFTWSTTNVLRANATYAIIYAANSNTLLNTFSGATGASLTNLVTGTKYSLRIRSELPSDNYYNSLSFIGDVLDIVTYPGKPGYVYNVTQLSNTTTNGPYEYIIYFGASEGNVASYTFVIKNNTGLVDTLSNTTPSVVSNKLTPARIYSYEITAQNTVGNVSETTTGTFSTYASRK
ncbi:uncharacterized protein LOC131957764 [Physella acuta]|uniref:uncharacterized protein LOC131957764 n=1 Tax=Physella acuta TaxID=109671 RepID=UPI0027DC1957|nr:uncharacterized protein LOC131957764 [Physella acuta]